MPKSKYTGYELNQSPFYRLESKAKLAEILRVSQRKLNTLTRSENLYTEKDCSDPKKGKSRHVEAPKAALKCVQKRIEDLLKRIEIPDYVHAPAKGRSYISNAKAHINAAVVRSLDIEKYFLSTPARRVYWFFHKRMRCSSDVAGILTRISTFKDRLPTGAPSSPILSYFSHIDMWESIDEIVKNANCNLTVYIDDVTISGDRVSNKLIWQIKQQFRGCGLRSNEKKEKCYIGKSSEITGIIVTTEGELKVPKRQYLKMRETRQALHSETESGKREKLIQKLKGLEAQVQQIKMANSVSPD